VQNYLEVNPEFGDLAKLRELVDQAHSKNIAVILDWVANHTSWDNPWIRNKSWYAQDSIGNIIIPPGTNWQDVAELNYDNKDLRKAMIHAMKYWVLEANVDGFRCDAVDYIPSDFWKDALGQLKAIKGREFILLAEGGKADNFAAGFQMNYAWDFYNNLKHVYGGARSATSIFATHLAEYNNIPAGARKLRYTTNHDESAWEATPVSLFGGKQGALSASVIAIFTSAVPMLYGSQEVGQSEKLPFFTQEPIDWSKNQEMLEEYEILFSIYNRTQTFIKGSLQHFDSDDFAVFKRTYKDEEYLIIVNVRNDARKLSLDNSLRNTKWMDTANSSVVSLESEISLGGYEYRILKK
jgi:1,4-alpha-glucan branching enzyme